MEPLYRDILIPALGAIGLWSLWKALRHIRTAPLKVVVPFCMIAIAAFGLAFKAATGYSFDDVSSCYAFPGFDWCKSHPEIRNQSILGFFKYTPTLLKAKAPIERAQPSAKAPAAGPAPALASDVNPPPHSEDWASLPREDQTPNESAARSLAVHEIAPKGWWPVGAAPIFMFPANDDDDAAWIQANKIPNYCEGFRLFKSSFQYSDHVREADARLRNRKLSQIAGPVSYLIHHGPFLVTEDYYDKFAKSQCEDPKAETMSSAEERGEEDAKCSAILPTWSGGPDVKNLGMQRSALQCRCGEKSFWGTITCNRRVEFRCLRREDAAIKIETCPAN